MIGPIVEQVVKITMNQVRVCKINVDEVQELAQALQVMIISNLVVIKMERLREKRWGYSLSKPFYLCFNKSIKGRM